MSEFILTIKLSTGGGINTFWEAFLDSEDRLDTGYTNARSFQELVERIQEKAEGLNERLQRRVG